MGREEDHRHCQKIINGIFSYISIHTHITYTYLLINEKLGHVINGNDKAFSIFCVRILSDLCGSFHQRFGCRSHIHSLWLFPFLPQPAGLSTSAQHPANENNTSQQQICTATNDTPSTIIHICHPKWLSVYRIQHGCYRSHRQRCLHRFFLIPHTLSSSHLFRLLLSITSTSCFVSRLSTLVLLLLSLSFSSHFVSVRLCVVIVINICH